MTRARRRNIQTRRITGKIHGKNVIWMVGQVIQPGILGEIKEKLEAMEGQETGKKRDDENDPGRRRRGRKIGRDRRRRQ